MYGTTAWRDIQRQRDACRVHSGNRSLRHEPTGQSAIVVLGIVGIYSILTYVVSQRRREIGVRLALGATAGDVVRDGLLRAFTLTVTGLIVGTVAVWWLTRGLTELFVGVSPHDLGAFAGAALGFMLAALLAASIPAFRTTRVSPAVALTSASH
jgi:putative ABC transport system permease protein